MNWLESIKWYLDNDPVVKIMGQMDTANLPIVPIYIYMYLSELYTTTRAFTKTFRVKLAISNTARRAAVLH